MKFRTESASLSEVTLSPKRNSNSCHFRNGRIANRSSVANSLSAEVRGCDLYPGIEIGGEPRYRQVAGRIGVGKRTGVEGHTVAAHQDRGLPRDRAAARSRCHKCDHQRCGTPDLDGDVLDRPICDRRDRRPRSRIGTPGGVCAVAYYSSSSPDRGSSRPRWSSNASAPGTLARRARSRKKSAVLSTAIFSATATLMN